MSNVKAVVFDAYGTLFDVHSVVDACEEHFPGWGRALSERWRTKQLEYTWLRSLMGRYRDFRQVTEDALAYACQELGLSLEIPVKERLMDAYLRLKPYPEVTEALRRLDRKKRVIFSNGSPDMLEPVVKNAAIGDLLDGILSVDEVKTYKPHPYAYTLVLEKLNVERESVLFVSSNAFDIAGAKSFGFRVAWVNRGKKVLDMLEQQPDWVIHDLRGLAECLRD
jgi:2-haloacid dehalogenase